jgi:hypothetical protein
MVTLNRRGAPPFLKLGGMAVPVALAEPVTRRLPGGVSGIQAEQSGSSHCAPAHRQQQARSLAYVYEAVCESCIRSQMDSSTQYLGVKVTSDSYHGSS